MLYRLVLFAVATSFAALGLVPLLWTYGSALSGRSSELEAIVLSSSTWSTLAGSVALGTLSAIGASALAAPLALTTARVSFRGRNAISVVALVPLALAPYNVALALRGWLPGGPLVASSLVLSLALYPIPFVFWRAALVSIDAELEEAGLLARGVLRTLGQVTWPLVRPWTFAALGVVFLLGLGEFGTPAFFGLPVYSSQIALRFAATYDAAGAAVAAIPLLGIVLLVLVIEGVALRRVEFFATRLRPALTLEPGRWIFPMQCSCWAILALSPGLPLVLTIADIDTPGLVNALPMVMRPALNSLLVALAGALVGWIVATALALVARRGVRAYRWLSLTWFVIPGTVLGVGLIGFWNQPSIPPLYGSMGLLVVAVVLRYTLLAEKTIEAALTIVPPAQEQVAQLAGRNEASIAARILCPQTLVGIVTGAGALALFVLRDLDTIVTIYPPGGETLAVRLYTVMANSPRGLQAALSLAQMVLTLPFVVLLVLALRNRRWLI